MYSSLDGRTGVFQHCSLPSTTLVIGYPPCCLKLLLTSAFLDLNCVSSTWYQLMLYALRILTTSLMSPALLPLLQQQMTLNTNVTRTINSILTILLTTNFFFVHEVRMTLNTQHVSSQFPVILSTTPTLFNQYLCEHSQIKSQSQHFHLLYHICHYDRGSSCVLM